jgi:putative transposase
MTYTDATARATSCASTDVPPNRSGDVDTPTIVEHIVFHRDDALSQKMSSILKGTAPAARLGRAEAWLDAGHGRNGLMQADLATDLAFAIRAPDGRYDLLAWCIMPTHVHVLIARRPSADLDEIVGHWTRGGASLDPRDSATDARVWSPTFFVVAGSGDAWIAATKRHIEGNPVAAGLACSPGGWRWSSASQLADTPRAESPVAQTPRSAVGFVQHHRATHVVLWLDDALSSAFPRKMARRISSQRAYMLDKALDASRGRQSLAARGSAESVQRDILASDGERYTLIAWCIMPTHIHILLSELDGWSVAEIVNMWKSETTAAANARRFMKSGRSPWAKDYSRTTINGVEEICDVRSYIEHNPVLSGLAKNPQAWKWSSAIDQRGEAGRS